MSKKLTDSQKSEIVNLFTEGQSIKEIAVNFDFSVQTISRQLKLILGDDKFNQIKQNIKEKVGKSKQAEIHQPHHDHINEETFFEITPLLDDINLEHQKDLTTKRFEEVNFPNIVFMIVDSKIELEQKILKDYPEWSFLPNDDLERGIIEIFSDQKIAKRKCNKTQKVIKVPNPNVFKIASKQIEARGISRIIFDDLLLAL